MNNKNLKLKVGVIWLGAEQLYSMKIQLLNTNTNLGDRFCGVVFDCTWLSTYAIYVQFPLCVWFSHVFFTMFVVLALIGYEGKTHGASREVEAKLSNLWFEKLKTLYASQKFSNSHSRNRINFYYVEYSSGIVGLWNLSDLKAKTL